MTLWTFWWLIILSLTSSGAACCYYYIRSLLYESGTCTYSLRAIKIKCHIYTYNAYVRLFCCAASEFILIKLSANQNNYKALPLFIQFFLEPVCNHIQSMTHHQCHHLYTSTIYKRRVVLPARYIYLGWNKTVIWVYEL